MAYGTKYSLAYDALESPSLDLATYLLTFELDGYSGSVISLNHGGGSPVVAKIKNNQDSAIGIKEKSLNIEILADLDLSELQRAKPKQCKVTHTKTVGSTTTVDFKGWLVPTNNGTAYEDGDKYIRLEANDGLEFLKNTDFVDDAGKYYEGLTSIFEIVQICLSKTGLGLNINTINNTYAVGNAQNDSDDALKQRYIDIDLYRGENEPFVAYKVLEQILLSEKCRICQEDGEWWFENVSEKRTGFVKARKYQANGTYISGGTLNLRIAALNNSNFQPMAGGEISSVPANKWVKATHKLGKFKNRLENRDFANIFVGDFIGWEKTANPVPSVSRVGAGTPSNPYGAKLTGVFSKNKDTGYLYQSVLLASTTVGNLQQAINTNIIFSGDAFTQDVDHALVSLVVRIKTSAFTYNGSTNIPETNTIHSLGDTGEWESGTFIELENKDVNNHSKKSAKSWEVISKRIGDITIPYGKSGRLGSSAWNPHVTEVSVTVRLHSGVGELKPSPGETKSCAVWYKKPFLSFVNTDTNRNLREINYKATQSDYAPNNDSFDVAYGDYVDGSNLSALKYADGSLTKLWTSESDNSPKNFHTLGVVDVLDETGGNPKVYDGTIWGLLKFRHSVELAGFSNRGYIVGYSYDYASSMADVRIIEHQDTTGISVKKTGVLSDGTEIDMIDDSPPSPVMGNGVGGGSTVSGGGMNIGSWIQQVLSGVQGYTFDEEPVNVVWGNVAADDAFDFGSIVRRNEKLIIGSNDDNLELGKSDSLTAVLGQFGIRNQNNFLAQFSVADLTANRTVTIPNRNIEVNKWADLSGVPSLFSPTTHTHQIGDIINLNAVLDAKQPLNGNLTSLGVLSTNGIVRRTGSNTFVIGTNDPITLTGDVNGTGTTAITTTLSNTGVAAGVYKSVTVDAKGRVTAGTLRSASNYLSDFGFIEDYSTQWNTRWLAKIDDFIEFGSDIQINGGLGVIGNLFLNGNFFDKDSSIGSANQVLMPVSGGGVAWTSLSTAQISNFSANVLGQLLTGYTVGSNTPLVASNSILTAFRNLQAQITAKTTAERLVFGNGFFQNHQFGNGFEYKTSAPVFASGLITGLFSFTSLTANRTWNMPDYNGTLTTYEKIDAEFWKIGGNNNITANAYFNIQSKYDLVNNVLVQQQPYSYIWAINQVDKMRLTPQGNLGVGGINPEAVIHAHATVVGNAEVIALKASNNTSSAYFSIGIDSTNNRTNFYAGGEVWATTVSKFKFAAADVSGLWTYSVIPQTTADATTGNQLVRLSQVQTLLSGGFSISTTCVLAFITNQTLSGSKTQGGYTTVTGDSILLTAQTTPSQNGVYIFDGTNWVRNTNNDTDTEIRGKGHLVTNGTYASTQWVNNNASTITVGTTAITYVQWSGAELDPVWEAYKAANDLTPTRFSNWNTAFGWGNHTNLYVDKVSTQADIAGAKTFTTSIQSPQVRAGNNTLYINISNHFGSSPRIASTAHMDFFATTDYYWYTNGNLGRMRLNTTGLRVGDANAAAYSLDVGGNVGISGLINVRNPITSTYSNGTDGQVILRKSVSGLNYNEWATLGVANISDIAATYQAKITGTENYLTKKTASNFGDSQLFDNGTSVVIGGTSAIDSAKFSVVGKIGATTARFGDNSSGINIGSLAINSTGALAYGATSHTWNVSGTEKLNIDATRLLLTGNLEIDGKIKVGGSYGLDHYFIKSLGVDGSGNPLGTEWAEMNCGEISDIADLYVSKIFADANYVKRITDDGERGFYLYGDAENTIKDGFIFSNPDTGIVGIHSFRLNNTTIEQFGYQLDKDGFPYWLFADGSRKRILTTNDTVGGGGGIWNGGIVSTSLDFQFTKQQRFLANNGSVLNIKNATGPDLGIVENTYGYHSIEAENGIFLDGGVTELVYIDNVGFDMSEVPSLVNQHARFYITSIGAGKFKAKIVAA